MKEKIGAGILLFLFNFGQFAREWVFPFGWFMDLLDPFISDEVYSLLSIISWILTFALFGYYILTWFLDVEEDEEEVYEKKLRRKTKK